MNKPEMLTDDKIDISSLKKLCKNYIDFEFSPEYHEDNDFKQYLFEVALETIYGKNIWEKLAKKNQEKE